MMNGINLGSLFTRGAALTTWQVGIYCRLSKDDDQQGESASIGNQRELLTNYCKAQGWTIAQVYQDDGYTGLNMERPGNCLYISEMPEHEVYADLKPLFVKMSEDFVCNKRGEHIFKSVFSVKDQRKAV